MELRAALSPARGHGGMAPGGFGGTRVLGSWLTAQKQGDRLKNKDLSFGQVAKLCFLSG